MRQPVVVRSRWLGGAGPLRSSGGVVSVMALNAATLSVRPALERRWPDAVTAMDAATETGVLGVGTRGDTVEGLSGLLRRHGVEPQAWYGVWLFSDWVDLPVYSTDVPAIAELELRARLPDPYRQLSRVFHLVWRSQAQQCLTPLQHDALPAQQ